MDVKFDGIIGFFTLPAYIFGALVIASGLLLFLPSHIIQSLYMIEFRDKYGFTIGIIFVVSLSLLVVLLFRAIYGVVVRKLNAKKEMKGQLIYLKKLSDNKVAIIVAFLREPNRTIMLPMKNGLIIELENYGVITPAGTTHFVSMPNPEIKYFLQPWVEDRIKSDSELRIKYGM